MSSPPNFNPGRRFSKAYLPPKIELVLEDDGKHAYNCMPNSSFDDSDSAASGRSRRGGRVHARKLWGKLLVDGFVLFGGVVAAVLLVLSCFTYLLDNWVLIEFAELLGFFALLGSAYLASSSVYSLCSSQCAHSVPLDSRAVVVTTGSYVVGAVCCNLALPLLPILPVEPTLLLLLAGWLTATNAFLHKDEVPPGQFLQQPKSYLFVVATLVQRVVLQNIFHAFIPTLLLPLIVHSCHLFGLTVATVIQGGMSRPAMKKLSPSSSLSKRRTSLRSSILYPPSHRVGARHSSMERRNSWTSVSSFASTRVSDTHRHIQRFGGLDCDGSAAWHWCFSSTHISTHTITLTCTHTHTHTLIHRQTCDHVTHTQ